MHPTARATARAALALLALAARPGSTTGQVPPHTHWQTITTPHARITFPPGLDSLAREAGRHLEHTYARLTTELGPPPDPPIDLLLTDQTDLANASATPFPSNRIVVFARPPLDDPGLAYHDDWLELVIAHELTHLFHLDRAGRWARAARRLLGRVPSAWPLFPAVATPQWAIEGLATYYESRLTGYGRTRGTYHEMILRTAALEGEPDRIDQASGYGASWPAGQRWYAYGSLFLDHLAHTHGEETPRHIVDHTAGALLPPPLAFDRIGRRATGTAFSNAWDEWRNELRRHARTLADSLHPLARPERLTRHGYFALYPRAGPDGRVAFTASDGRDQTATHILDPATGRVRELARRNGLGLSDWLPDGSGLITAQLEFDGPYRIVSDLYRVGLDGHEDRLTRGARLAQPDIDPAGRRAVAVQHAHGLTRLVLYDLETGALRPLTDYRPDTGWDLPRWAPDGRRIAAARARPGGFHDIVVLDTTGATLFEPPADRALDGGPAWSPDGRYLVFWSDRSGIPNLYAYDLAATPGTDPPHPPTLRQITRVPTGALYPDISPDGRWIYFAGYHADGFHIERVPFDPEAWAEPDPLDPRFLPRVAAPTTPDAASAAPPADTPHPYSALPTLRPFFWLPTFLDAGPAGHFWGAWTAGQDLVGRHAYAAALGLDFATGRTTGSLDYRYAGLGNPVLDATLSRDWETLGTVRADSATLRPVIEREDALALQASLLDRHWRSAATLTLGIERVTRRRWILDAPRLRLLDPTDELAGATTRISWNTARAYPFSISPEDGVTLALGARRRWDIDGDSIREGYDEASAWAAAYLGLDLWGHAHHVLALRTSALVRHGPGATPHDVGGTPTTPTSLLGLGTGDVPFLPARGFPPGTAAGTRAWTASLEYRLPLALVERGSRLRPLFLDDISATLFLDAATATCPAEQRRRFRCGATDPDSPTRLLATGAELGLDIALLFLPPIRLRQGIALPLHGPGDHRPRAYAALGLAF